MLVMEYKIEGMSCKHCETRIMNTLKRLEGVENVVVMQDNSSLKIFGDQQPPLEKLSAVLKETGNYKISNLVV